MTDEECMELALREAEQGIAAGDGGPFGAVVILDGKVAGRGHNRVLLKHDPTCHGEMEAIRDACARLGTHDLSGAVIYTTGEPCPMCHGAILWANIAGIVYGCRREDAEEAGFRDRVFHEQISGGTGGPVIREAFRERCRELFARYREGEHTLY